jgi:hypothetical protein
MSTPGDAATTHRRHLTKGKVKAGTGGFVRPRVRTISSNAPRNLSPRGTSTRSFPPGRIHTEP